MSHSLRRGGFEHLIILANRRDGKIGVGRELLGAEHNKQGAASRAAYRMLEHVDRLGEIRVAGRVFLCA